MAKSAAAQTTMQALAELAQQDQRETWAENAVLVQVDDKTSVDIDSAFHGNYGMVQASAYNDAADLCRVVVYQFLHPKANINPDVSGFNLSPAEKRAYDALFKLRTIFGFTPDSQEKFSQSMRTAQEWYVKTARRKHPLSLGNLVSAVAAHTVHHGKAVPSFLETAAKRFKENLAKYDSVIKPEGAKDDDSKGEGSGKTAGSTVSLKPSEVELVKAASRELSKAASLGKIKDILDAVKAAQDLLSRVGV